ncbi:MAG: hypothetical protein ACYSSP_01020 [Planctomycetota bacterium]|jgi:hypothetical protein
MRFTKGLILIFVLISFIAPCQQVFGQSEAVEKEATLRKVAGQWIMVGIEEYQRGMYLQAETAFLHAREYYLYMSKEQRKTLDDFSERTHKAYLEVISLSKQVENARQLFAERKLIEASQTVNQINSNEYLTDTQKQQFNLMELETEINSLIQRRQRQVNEVFGLSIDAYRNGEFETAKRGFEAVIAERLTPPVQRTAAEGYVERIDLLMEKERTPFIEVEQILEAEDIEEETGSEGAAEPLLILPPEPIVPIQERPEPVKVESPAPKTPEQLRKEKLLRSYSQAVVNDATKKAKTFIEIGDTFKARQAIRSAEKVLNENREHLGEELYQAYTGQLNELSQQIE